MKKPQYIENLITRTKNNNNNNNNNNNKNNVRSHWKPISGSKIRR